LKGKAITKLLCYSTKKAWLSGPLDFIGKGIKLLKPNYSIGLSRGITVLAQKMRKGDCLEVRQDGLIYIRPHGALLGTKIIATILMGCGLKYFTFPKEYSIEEMKVFFKYLLQNQELIKEKNKESYDGSLYSTLYARLLKKQLPSEKFIAYADEINHFCFIYSSRSLESMQLVLLDNMDRSENIYDFKSWNSAFHNVFEEYKGKKFYYSPVKGASPNIVYAGKIFCERCLRKIASRVKTIYEFEEATYSIWKGLEVMLKHGYPHSYIGALAKKIESSKNIETVIAWLDDNAKEYWRWIGS